MRRNTFGLTLACLFTLVGCNKAPETTTTQTATTTTAQQTTSQLPANVPTYTMAVEGSGQPFTFKDETGKIVGFDVDLIEAIGQKQGFKVEAFAKPWDTIFQQLAEGKHDIVGSGVAITPERQQTMSFSEPYMDSYMAVAYTSPTIKEFNNLTNKKIGVQVGTNYADFAKKNFPTSTVEFPTMFLAYQNMQKGEVDAVIDDVNMLNSQKVRLKNDNVHVIKVPNAENDKFAFAIKKDRQDLVDKINKGLAEVKADGTYNKIYSKWFGTAPAQ